MYFITITGSIPLVAGGKLCLDGIIHPVVSALTLIWFILEIYFA